MQKKNEKDFYETIISYSGSILPTKSLITNGHYFFKSPREIALNDSKLKMMAKFDNKIVNNSFNNKYFRNDSSLVKECINGIKE